MGWTEAVEPLTCVVSCNGASHRLLWARGQLTLADHDVEAELALRALGGPNCTCLEVADLFSSPVGPAEVYALWTTSAEWPSTATAGSTTGGGPATPSTLGQRVADDRRHALIASLPLALRRRRALQALAVLPAVGEPLHRIVGSLATPAVRATLPASTGPVDVRVSLREGPAQLQGEVAAWGGWARLHVSPRWVPDTWACSRTSHAGGLVLGSAVTGAGNSALRVAQWRLNGDRWTPHTTWQTLAARSAVGCEPDR